MLPSCNGQILKLKYIYQCRVFRQLLGIPVIDICKYNSIINNLSQDNVHVLRPFFVNKPRCIINGTTVNILCNYSSTLKIGPLLHESNHAPICTLYYPCHHGTI